MINEMALSSRSLIGLLEQALPCDGNADNTAPRPLLVGNDEMRTINRNRGVPPTVELTVIVCQTANVVRPSAKLTPGTSCSAGQSTFQTFLHVGEKSYVDAVTKLRGRLVVAFPYRRPLHERAASFSHRANRYPANIVAHVCLRH